MEDTNLWTPHTVHVHITTHGDIHTLTHTLTHTYHICKKTILIKFSKLFLSIDLSVPGTAEPHSNQTTPSTSLQEEGGGHRSGAFYGFRFVMWWQCAEERERGYMGAHSQSAHAASLPSLSIGHINMLIAREGMWN